MNEKHRFFAFGAFSSLVLGEIFQGFAPEFFKHTIYGWIVEHTSAIATRWWIGIIAFTASHLLSFAIALAVFAAVYLVGVQGILPQPTTKAARPADGGRAPSRKARSPKAASPSAAQTITIRTALILIGISVAVTIAIMRQLQTGKEELEKVRVSILSLAPIPPSDDGLKPFYMNIYYYKQGNYSVFGLIHSAHFKIITTTTDMPSRKFSVHALTREDEEIDMKVADANLSAPDASGNELRVGETGFFTQYDEIITPDKWKEFLEGKLRLYTFIEMKYIPSFDLHAVRVTDYCAAIDKNGVTQYCIGHNRAYTQE